jgi:hypothetical protein
MMDSLLREYLFYYGLLKKRGVPSYELKTLPLGFEV